MCKHIKTKSNFKMDTRSGQQIIIRYTECERCHKILGGGVSFVEPRKEEIKPVAPVVAAPPASPLLVPKNEPKKTIPAVKVEPPKPAPVKPKEEVKAVENKSEVSPEIKMTVEKVAPPAPKKEPKLRDAEHFEKNLEREDDVDEPVGDNPFSERDPGSSIPAKVMPIEDVDDEAFEDDNKKSEEAPFTEGGAFLKESHASIKKRRQALKRRRERALARLKKKQGPEKIVAPSPIQHIEDPDRPSKEDEYN